MITEDYVSFEIAKLLKEKGFNEQIRDFYRFENNIWIHRNTYEHNYFNLGMPRWENCYSCPTLQMTMKWLREVYKVHIIAEPCLGEGNEPNLCFNRWFWTILTESGEYKPIRKIDEFPTYEKACEDAIKYCLENLI